MDHKPSAIAKLIVNIPVRDEENSVDWAQNVHPVLLYAR